MTAPIISCPNCKTKIRLTEALAAPLIASARQQLEKQFSQKNAEIAQREQGARDKETLIAEAKCRSDEQKLCSKLYDETRADLLKRQLSNSENADRAVLSVSTAALGFSLAFLKDIVPLSDAHFVWMLYLLWLVFIFAIMVTVVSFSASQNAIAEQLKIAQRYYLERDDSAGLIENREAKKVEILNKSGAFFLLLGLIMTFVFVGVNLSKGKIMSNEITGIRIIGWMEPDFSLKLA